MAGVLDDAYEIVDHLNVLHGADWERIRVTVGPVAGTMAVQSTEVRPIGGSDAPPPMPMDRGLRTAFLSHTIARARERLAGDGLAWDGSTVECVRLDAHEANVRFVDRSGVVAADVRIRYADLMFGREFLMRVGRSIEAIVTRQRKVDDLVRRHTSKSWDREADPHTVHMTLATNESLRIDARVVGSHSGTEQTFCWAWANRSFPPPAVEAVRALFELGKQPGLGVFRMPSFPCDPPFAWLVAAIAADAMDGRRLLPWPLANRPITLYFAIRDPFAP